MDVKDLLNLKFGWLTKDERIIPCGLHDHLTEEIINELNDAKIKSFYEEGTKEVEAAEQGCLDFAADGEHPEWHHYEMCYDSFRFGLVDLIYERGNIRIGVSGRNYEFEGKLSAFQKLADRIDEIQEFLDSRGYFFNKRIVK